MKKFTTALIVCLVFITTHADRTTLESFIGTFRGDVEVSENQQRTLEVIIKKIKSGFNVSWKTITTASSGSGKSKSYSIDFVASDRQGIYGSAMKANLFGGQEALDPIKGEPYFWARVDGNTLTIFGMLITEQGDYEVQRYDRTVTGDEMLLEYSLTRGETKLKTISANLTRQ